MNACYKNNLLANIGRVAVTLALCCCSGTMASETTGHDDVHAAKPSSHEKTNGAAPSRNPDAQPEVNKVAAVASPIEINPAFRDAADDLVSTNIVEKHTVEPGSSKQADLDAMLEWARRMKREKNFDAAEKSFVNVLGADAPEIMHRTALLEMGLMAQENQQHTRAQQVFTQYLERYPDDPSAAEVYLRQGLLYRQMGAPTMALSKFYAVLTTSMRLKLDRLEYYQRLVLQAQTEICLLYTSPSPRD